MTRDPALASQIARFILVGIVSTAIHFIVAAQVESTGSPAQIANFIGFICAATWSFLGNLYFTFRAGGKMTDYLARFVIVSGSLFVTSALLVWFINQQLGFPFIIAMIAMALTSPIVSFLLQKLWVFRV